jgi:hypothetical protein
MKRTWLLPAALAGLMAAGCGGKASVEGTVRYEDGSPVSGATVVFVPVGGGGTAPTGYTDSSGRFRLKTGNESGARRGKYKVLVTRPAKDAGAPLEAGSADAIKAMKKTMPRPGPARKAPAADSELEARYASAEQTPLSAEIPASGELAFTVKAKKAGKR